LRDKIEMMPRRVQRALLQLAVFIAALPSFLLASEPGKLETAVKEAERLPRIHSLLVSQHGSLILERYFHGTTQSTYQNIKSASKSIISALVGIAVERGLLPGVKTPIASYFPELSATTAAKTYDPRKKQITIEDLLTMRSGLESTSRWNYGAWVGSPDWVKFTLTRRLLANPGEQMDYSTGNTHLLSAILTKASHHDT
jgi:CubicO group peptidase (beta-lactamase class C family)